MVSQYKRRKKVKLETRTALEIIEETIFLLRNQATRLLLPYFAGTIPFILGFMYFCADMSRSAFAHEHCAKHALILALLFVWMKVWQSIYATRLYHVITMTHSSHLTLRQSLRRVAYQTIIHSYGLLILPLALLITFPFPATHAFFQNILSTADGRHAGLRHIIHHTTKLSTSEPKQNVLLMWMLCPWILGTTMFIMFGGMYLSIQISPHDYHYLDNTLWFLLSLAFMFYVAVPFSPLGYVLAANIAVLIAILPMAASSLFGIETPFSLVGIHGITNITFLGSVFSLTFLIMDPVMKAAYVVRRFYTEAQSSGADLLLELNEIGQAKDAS